jgi:hypothetical protein
VPAGAAPAGRHSFPAAAKPVAQASRSARFLLCRANRRKRLRAPPNPLNPNQKPSPLNPSLGSFIRARSRALASFVRAAQSPPSKSPSPVPKSLSRRPSRSQARPPRPVEAPNMPNPSHLGPASAHSREVCRMSRVPLAHWPIAAHPRFVCLLTRPTPAHPRVTLAESIDLTLVPPAHI